jgi:hypothetical protein
MKKMPFSHRQGAFKPEKINKYLFDRADNSGLELKMPRCE